MGKRANTKSAQAKVEAPAKKAKMTVDTAFTSVLDAIMEADIPDRVRAMLVEMMPHSLKFASDERHELQNMAVDMVEQTLTAKKDTLAACVVVAEGDLAGLKASESQLGGNVTSAEAALTAQKDVAEAKKNALADATEADKASTATLSEKRAEQKNAEKKFVALETDKAAIEAAFAEHFPPMEEGESKAHYKKLEPFLKKIEVESTLLTALPACCAKTKDKRGSFDNLVLVELDKAFKAKIAALSEAVANEVPAAAERQNSVQEAEKDCAAKKAALDAADVSNAAALKALEDCESALSNAKKAVADFAPKLEEMTRVLSTAQQVSAEFEASPYANFLTYKSRVAAVPEEPMAQEAPAKEAPANEDPAEEAPVEAAPATEASAEAAPAE